VAGDRHGERQETPSVGSGGAVPDGELAAGRGAAQESQLRGDIVVRRLGRAGAEDVAVEIAEREIEIALLLRRQAAERLGAEVAALQQGRPELGDSGEELAAAFEHTILLE